MKGMPVVMVNPSRPRRRRNAKRRGKRRAARRARRRSNPTTRRRRRRNPSRRKNPTSTGFWGALGDSAIGGIGGGLAYGLHFGASYAPVSNIWQTVILGVGGTAVAAGTSAWADQRAGAGLMGGVIALVAGRIHAQLSLGGVAEKRIENGNGAGRMGARSVMSRLSPGNQAPRTGASAVKSFSGPLPAWRQPGARGAAKVMPRGAGAMMGRGGGVAPSDPASMARMGFANQDSFRVPVGAGAVRLMGPRSWVYNTPGAGADAVYVSAHDVRR